VVVFGLYVCGNKLKPSRKAYDTSSHKKGKGRSEEKGEENKEEEWSGGEGGKKEDV
jgi:hypothetical protein